MGSKSKSPEIHHAFIRAVDGCNHVDELPSRTHTYQRVTTRTLEPATNEPAPSIMLRRCNIRVVVGWSVCTRRRQKPQLFAPPLRAAGDVLCPVRNFREPPRIWSSAVLASRRTSQASHPRESAWNIPYDSEKLQAHTLHPLVDSNVLRA